MNIDKKVLNKAARTIAKAGKMPFPVTETFLSVLDVLLTDEQARFIADVFTKPSLTLEQILEKVDQKYDKDAIVQLLGKLLKGGIISSAISQSAGVRVYRLMQPVPGLMEYSLLRGETTEKEKKLAKLWDKLYKELSKGTQKNYDFVIPQYEKIPAIDRVVPVEEEINLEKIGQEAITPFEEVSKFIDKCDDIAVAHCYCRHEKDLLGDPCKLNAPKKNCFFFDKSAKHIIEHEFGESISKEEAKKLFKEAEDYGLVHKVFHVQANPEGKVEAICNCCSCCCGTFHLYRTGAMPFTTLTSYIAEINPDECVGCNACVNACPIEALEIHEDNIASLIENKCIGCGVCVHMCPQEPKAISLRRTGLRRVFIPPPKITKS
ncbi:MAG: 4Fe-4S binding protein [Candidatus Lokiarchaeota archaeon]|nr:4Fe-4S binding protein [Candidatus Lokiarchaeota archaeon]